MTRLIDQSSEVERERGKEFDKKNSRVSRVSLHDELATNK